MPYVLAYEIANIFIVGRVRALGTGHGWQVYIQSPPDGARVPICAGNSTRGGGRDIGSRSGVYIGLGGRARERKSKRLASGVDPVWGYHWPAEEVTQVSLFRRSRRSVRMGCYTNSLEGLIPRATRIA
jgi:hypothetical protein